MISNEHVSQINQLFTREPLLPISLVPEEGENLHGYIFRLAEANGYSSLQQFCDALGFSKTYGAESDLKFWSSLSTATGLNEDTLSSMRWKKFNSNPNHTFVNYFGHPVGRLFIFSTKIKICPVCTTEGHTIHNFNMLAYVTCCPAHKTLLVERCHKCNRPLIKKHIKGPWRCICNHDIRDCKTTVAPEGPLYASLTLSMLFQLSNFFGHPLPNTNINLMRFLVNITPHDYMALIHTIGLAALQTGNQPESQTIKHNRYLKGSLEAKVNIDIINKRIIAALNIFEGWPQSFWKIMDTIRNTKSEELYTDNAKIDFNSQPGKMLLYPMIGFNGLPVQLLQNEVRRYLDNRYRSKFRQFRFTTQNATAQRLKPYLRLITIKDACQGINWHTLHCIYKKILFEFDIEKLEIPDKELAELTREMIISRYQSFFNTSSSVTTKHILEGHTNSKKQLYGWEHPDLLPLDPTLQGIVKYNVYDNCEIERALQRIRNSTKLIQNIDGLISLYQAVRRNGILHAKYRKPQIILDIMNEKIPSFSNKPFPKLYDIYICINDLKSRSEMTYALSSHNSTIYASPKALLISMPILLNTNTTLPAKLFRRMRQSGIVRFRTNETRTYFGTYEYHVGDTMLYIKKFILKDGLT